MRFEYTGFIKRSVYPQNRRERVAELTEKGKRRYAEPAEIQKKWTEKVSACFPKQENEEFSRLRGQLAAGAEEVYKRTQK